MADPLSIATGIIALIQATVTVAYELKKFHDNATLVGQTISDLQHDVDSFTGVLESIRETFESITAEHGSGHVGTLWSNVARSIEDGKGVLDQIQSQLRDINKETRFLDDHRKQLRLNRSEPKMARFRVQIQSYRDSLQLSVQAIILWNQTSYQKTADQVLPNLSALHDDVRRIALDLNQRIESLQAMVASKQDEVQVVAMENLRDCVRSAASTISSATTIVASREGASQNLTSSSSDFGDVFPVQYNVAMRRWVESNTVYEYDEAASRAPPQSIADVPTLEESDKGSDSDVDLEDEMTRLALDAGKQKLAAGDSKGCERMLRSCLRKLESPSTTRAAEKSTIQLDVIVILHDLYISQQRWTEAQKMLLQKMAIQERLLGKKDPELLENVLNLAKLQMRKGDFVEAQLHARRALKGYRKLRQPAGTRACLTLLVDICDADGNESDQEVYAAMLTSLKEDDESAASPSSSQVIALGASSETLRDQQRAQEDASTSQDTTAQKENTGPQSPTGSISALKVTPFPEPDSVDTLILKASRADDGSESPTQARRTVLEHGSEKRTVSLASTFEVVDEASGDPKSSSKPIYLDQVLSQSDSITRTENHTAPPPPMVVPPATTDLRPAGSHGHQRDPVSRTSVVELKMWKSNSSGVVEQKETSAGTSDLEISTPGTGTIWKPNYHKSPLPTIVEPLLTRRFSFSQAADEDLFSQASLDGSKLSKSTDFESVESVVSQDDLTPSHILTKAISAPDIREVNSKPSSQHTAGLAVPSWSLLADDVQQVDFGTTTTKEPRKHSRNESAPLLHPSVPNMMGSTTSNTTGPPVGGQTKLALQRSQSFESNLAWASGSDPLRPARSISVSKPKPGSFPPRIKVVVVGDSCSGKTPLLQVLSKKEFPDVWVPTTIHNDVTW